MTKLRMSYPWLKQWLDAYDRHNDGSFVFRFRLDDGEGPWHPLTRRERVVWWFRDRWDDLLSLRLRSPLYRTNRWETWDD